jgi:ABC-2 type transport system ATP-binding protein
VIEEEALPAVIEQEPRPAVIDVRGLAKRYGPVEALAGLDLSVGAGEVYGFLGRNGAGKSTTIRILMGITKPSGGDVRLFGEPTSHRIDYRQRIGYVAQEQNFYGWMTPTSLGRFVRGFYPTWNDARYAELIRGLDLPARRKIRTFSGGMKVKLALAAALAHDPELLVLDEPTAGLDPVARREFLEMVRDQAERSGRTTFFSTHLIDEIELAAHRLAIVDEGRTRYEGTAFELATRVRRLWRPLPEEGVAELPPAFVGQAPAVWRILQDRQSSGRREVIVQAEPEDFDVLLEDAGEWRIEELPLEEIFIEMVRKSLRAA